MKAYESEVTLLKNYNYNLNNRISNLEKNKSRKEEQNPKDNNTLDFREKRIKFLENLVKSKENDLEYLRSLIKKLNSVMSNISDFYILKKLDTL